uniref:NADH-ubiquinone oxidoreductase chain 4L n=1 Tax=Carios mexicanus TaxID=34600 RepID=W0FGR5_CARMN|nr:NADH dehydrogenase subunit 4L [Antricola mexicanus]AHF21661.1 NADH dehydrogenase subunit 4L [Antricola mexicanus]
MNLIGSLIFIGGLLSILMNRKHVLILLLCLEMMYIGIMYCVFVGICSWGSMLNMIVLMFFIVCEAGLGLSILVGNVFFYGNDKVSTMVLIKC